METEVCFPVVPRYKQHVWCGGRICEVPRSPLKLFGTPLLPRALKWKLPLILFRKGIATPQADDESVAVYFDRFLGSEVVRDLLAPALQGVYGGDVGRLSARTVFPELWEASKRGGSLFSYAKTKRARRTLVFKQGMASLIGKLETSLRGKVEFIRRRAVLVRRSGAGLFEVVAEGGEGRTFNKVAVSTSGAASARFIAELDPALAHRLEALRYAPIVVVHAAVSAAEPVPPKSYGVLFPPGHPDALLGVMFNSMLFPHTAPPGQHLLTVCLGGIHGGHILSRSDTEIYGVVLRELEQKLGLSGARMLAIYRWAEAIPQYEVGHWQLVEMARALERRAKGLVCIGADMGGVGVPDRVKLALSSCGGGK